MIFAYISKDQTLEHSRSRPTLDGALIFGGARDNSLELMTWDGNRPQFCALMAKHPNDDALVGAFGGFADEPMVK